MALGALTWAGTTLIGAAATPMTNGLGYWNLLERKPAAPVVVPVTIYGVAGLGAKRIGRRNTPETAGSLFFGTAGQRRTCGYYTSVAAAQAAIDAMEALQQATPFGTLVYDSQSWFNMWWEHFAAVGPIVPCTLGSCNVRQDFEFGFRRLG